MIQFYYVPFGWWVFLSSFKKLLYLHACALILQCIRIIRSSLQASCLYCVLYSTGKSFETAVSFLCVNFFCRWLIIFTEVSSPEVKFWHSEIVFRNEENDISQRVFGNDSSMNNMLKVDPSNEFISTVILKECFRVHRYTLFSQVFLGDSFRYCSGEEQSISRVSGRHAPVLYI